MIAALLLLGAANVAAIIPVASPNPHWEGPGCRTRRHEAKPKEISSGGRFDISRYGAKAGEKCTEAFAKAFDACDRAGGGRVVVPKGRWFTGAVRFRSNCELHLERGAEVVFSQDPRDYLPAVFTSWEGMECWNYCPLVYAYGCTNVAITGEGTLRAFEGKFRDSHWNDWVPPSNGVSAARLQLYTWGATDEPLGNRQIWKMPNARTRPHFIQFNRCKNVRLSGFAVRESPFWTIHLYLCDGVVAQDLDVRAQGNNSDGIDIEMSRNVLVERCRFDQWDDTFVIKAGRNRDGWRIGVPTENVEIRNCHMGHAYSFFCCGSEISAGVRNVYIHDCSVSNCERLCHIKTNRRRGGFVEGIRMENMRAGRVDSVLAVETDVLYEWAAFPDYELRMTRIGDIALRNVSCDEADCRIYVDGSPKMPVRGIRLENVKVAKTSRPDVIRNADRVVRVGDVASAPCCTNFAMKGWLGDVQAAFDLKGDAIATAMLEYTFDHGEEKSRTWKTVPAVVSNDVATARPPNGATGFRMRAVTTGGRRMSSDAIVAPPLAEGIEDLVYRPYTPTNIRNGEGDTIALKDGRMMLAWSHFTNFSSTNNTTKKFGTDGYSASFYRLVSPDGGKTWPGEPEEIVKNDAGLNVMCASFLRLKDGRLALFHLKKEAPDDCRPVMRVSSDEGRTWSASMMCVDEAHRNYYVVNNARVIRLKSGRIVLPMALHRHDKKWKVGDKGFDCDEYGEVLCSWSDDEGQTWKVGEKTYQVHRADGSRNGAQEPGIIELKDGRVMMYIRSFGQTMAVAYSSDGCETWSEPVVGPCCSPDSPAVITRLSSGELVMVYNDHQNRKGLRRWRTPLVIAVSTDDGQTWGRHKSIEDNLLEQMFCYPSLREYDGKLFISYYCDDMRSLRLKSVPTASVLKEK